MKVAVQFLLPTPDPEIPFARRYDEMYSMIAHADEHNYEAVWITEHHFSNYGYSANPLMLLLKAAEIAPSLRLGTAILVLPLWHPLRLAEDVAILDQLSGGRVDLGIGRGYQPYEFVPFGQDMAENRDTFSESLNIILQAFTEDDFSHEGRYWRIPPTTVFPKPLQEPHPPIWMAATSPPSIRTAVERGYHLMTGTGALAGEVAQRNAFIDKVARDLGKQVDQVERSATRFVFCSDDPREIQQAIDCTRWQVRASRNLNRGTPPVRGRMEAPAYEGELDDDAWQARCIFGDPDECIRRVEALSEAGISYLLGHFEFGGIDPVTARRSLERFTRDVKPALAEMKTVYSDPGALVGTESEG